MADPHVISALKEKRAKVSGCIARLERQLDQRRTDLTHIDGVLRLFAPDSDPDLIKPKRTYARRTRYFARNELSHYYNSDAVRMFIGPEATEWSAPISVPQDIATEALNGSMCIYVWGRVDYQDIFDSTRPHFTEWCYQLIFIGSDRDVNTQFVAYGDYNGSDEDREVRRGRSWQEH